MALEPFAESRALTLGVELELQIVSTHDYNLINASGELLRRLAGRRLPGDIKPEITASMIELSTGVCTGHADVFAQLSELRDALVEAGDHFNVGLCGGGTHPFQHWGEQRISDAPRYRNLSELYGYLAKQFTVFGQHVHVGCAGADEALQLLHGLSRFVPHFIALAAASPFVQGYDTRFQSARINAVAAFPMSGRAPCVDTWDDFAAYYARMADTGVISSMKDFYWDIRPKPEFGTIEVRVMDTPFDIATAARIAAYIQALACWLRRERPFRSTEDDYLVYGYNRFQASRFGLAGVCIDPRSHQQRSLRDDILATLATIEAHAIDLGADGACGDLRAAVAAGVSDADWARDCHARENSLPELVRQQCLRWRRG